MKILDDIVGDFDMIFKVILIGDSGVGKTSILMKFADKIFSDSYISTIGVDFKTKLVELDNGKIAKLQIWDTAGQERFRTITSSYYRGAHGVILVYDVCNASSFANISQWNQEVEKSGAKNIPLLLVGNKADLTANRKITYEEGKAKADYMGIPFLEISAKTNADISIVFSTIINSIKEKTVKDAITEQEKRKIYNKPIIPDKPKPKKDNCC